MRSHTLSLRDGFHSTGAWRETSRVNPFACRHAFVISKLQSIHLLMAHGEVTWRWDGRRLARPGMPATPSCRSGSWYSLTANRASTLYRPYASFRVRTHPACEICLDTLQSLRGLETSNFFHASSSVIFAARTNSASCSASSGDNSRPSALSHPSATHADVALSISSTWGLSSGFRR